MKYFLLISFVFVFSFSRAQTGTSPVASTAPDAFGYTWALTPNVPDNWIDIENTGVVAGGMGDDNIIGPIGMGNTFKYYWNEYTEVYIGSNGYLMFGEAKLIASGAVAGGAGFQAIPFAGDQNNNFIAGYLSDLTFKTKSGAPAPGAKLVYQVVGTKFVVSFINVPFWNTTPASTEISGSNTFQFVLDASDNSIQLNYKNHGTARYSGYSSWIRIGIENITSQIGMQVRGGSLTTPGINQLRNSSIKFTYPSSTSYVYNDVAANALFEKGNYGITVPRGSTSKIRGVVKNTGTTQITNNVTARALVLDEIGNEVYNSQVVLSGLAKGKDTLVEFPTNFTQTSDLKSYTCLLNVSANGDQYAPNNAISSKLTIIDTVAGGLVIKHTNPIYDPNDVGVGSQNAGMYLESPTYPVALRKVSVDILWTNEASVPSTIPNWQSDSLMPMTVKLYAGNGTNNSIGSFIDSFVIKYPNSMFDIDTVGVALSTAGDTNFYILRHTMTLAKPMIWKNGPLYAGVFMDRNTGFLWNGLAAEANNIASYRSLEMPGGIWGQSRNRDSTDYAIGAIVTFDTSGVSYPAATISAASATTFCQGGSVSLSANQATSYLWSNGAATQTITTSVAGNYSCIVTYPNNSKDTSNVIAVVVNPKPTATITSLPTNPSVCSPSTVTLTANTAPAYLWSTGATTASITASTTGNYWVRIRSAVGCVDTSDIVPVTVTRVDTSITVAGGLVTAKATNATYQWLDCSNGFTPVPNATNPTFTITGPGSFAVEVTQNSCKGISRCVTLVSNTKTLSNKLMSLAPNPSQGDFEVTLLQPAELVLVNQMGQEVYRGQSKAGVQRILIPTLSRGVYNLTARFAEGVQVQKVIIQ